MNLNESFQFNEVADQTGVKPYVLRFWESEFEQINPYTSEAGDKIYSKKDLEVIHSIKFLLFEKKLSIQEAKNELRFGYPDLSEKQAELRGDLNLADNSHAVNSKVREKLGTTLESLNQIISKYNW
jgi:DNA-binding transcriptional MerR regulator